MYTVYIIYWDKFSAVELLGQSICTLNLTMSNWPFPKAFIL